MVFPFYPVLAGLVPALAVYSANIAFLPMVEPWVPLLTGVTMTVTLALLLRIFFRSWARSAFLSTWLFVGFFGFSTATTPFVAHINFVVVWITYTVVLLLGGYLGVKFIKPSALPNIFFLILVGLLGSNTISKTLLQPQFRQVITASKATATVSRLPDIYYIILDGYGRTDVFKSQYGFDDTPVINDFKENGFYIASDARSNYCQTEISIASSLNYEYINTLLPGIKLNEESRQPFDELMRHSRIQQELKSIGYETISITTGFPPMNFPDSDQDIRVNGGLNLLESSLVQLTPIGKLDHALESMYKRQQNWIEGAFQNLSEISTRSNRPRFVIVHILAPHPPFVFNADGTFNRPAGAYGYQDGSDYMEQGGTVESYKLGYSKQATYIGRRTLDAVRQIVAKSPDAVIIIQGDHGPKAHLNQNDLDKTDVNEVFPILNAYRVPDSMKASLYPGITPVNSFRIVLNGLTDLKLPLLPDTSYYSGFTKPYGFTNITSRLRTRPQF